MDMPTGLMMPANSEKQLSDEQSRAVAALVREELARRRISRQQLADLAKISISTLEKALSGRRPFTLATTIRLEEALGVALRKASTDGARAAAPAVTPGAGRARLLLASGGVVHRGHLPHATPVVRRPRRHLRLPHRDLLGCRHVEPDLPGVRAARRRLRPAGTVSVPNESGYVYLVTNRQGQYRLVIVSRPTYGEMFGIMTTLQWAAAISWCRCPRRSPMCRWKGSPTSSSAGSPPAIPATRPTAGTSTARSKSSSRCSCRA